MMILEARLRLLPLKIIGVSLASLGAEVAGVMMSPQGVAARGAAGSDGGDGEEELPSLRFLRRRPPRCLPHQGERNFLP